MLPLLPFALSFSVLVPAAAAQTAKISAPLAVEQRFGRVSDFQFTHDGLRVVYRDDRDAAYRFDLFSRRLDGSAPSERLNGPLPAGGSVGVSNFTGSFAVGAQDRVVYWADEAADDVSELFSVPADGSASRIRISAPGQQVGFVRLDPAGVRAFYQDADFFVEPFGPLHVVPVDGSAPPLLLSPLNVNGFWLSPDGAKLAFSAASTPSSSSDLFVMPSDGSAPPLFLAHTPPFPAGISWFDDLVFTLDGLHVVYQVHAYDFDDIHDITPYSVPLDGSAPPTQLFDPSSFSGEFELVPTLPERVVRVVGGGDLFSKTTAGASQVQLSPSGTNFVSDPLVVDKEVVFAAFGASTGLYRAPADGLQPATLLCTGANSAKPVLANPTTVLFRASQPNSSLVLNAVPLAGGTPLPLHPVPPRFGGSYAIVPHPDGQRVLFGGDIEVQGISELFIVPLDASQPPLKLSPPMVAGESVKEIEVTADATRVAFRAGQGNGGPDALYVAPVDGSAPALRMSESARTGVVVGDVTSFQVTPDASRLVYRADQDVDEDFELLAVDQHGVVQRLGDGTGKVLATYALTPDSTRVVFQTLAGATRLLRAAGLADGVATTLDSSASDFPSPFRIEGERLVYRRAVSATQDELCSVALDGLSPPVVLHAPLPSFASVTEFRVGAAGVVVFVADLLIDGVFDLWAAPILGGVSPVRIGPALGAGGGVTAVELDASGTWAAFLVDASVDSRFELYSAPVDGSRPARRISGPLPPLGDVMEFALTPDGERVVYRADQRANQRFELFSVPLRGAPPPHATPGGAVHSRTTLLSPLPQGRAVEADWKLTADGAAVVYRANPTDVGVLELLRAPVDGGAAPVILSGALPATSDVTMFRLASDQSRVAFVADSRANDVFEPFSVPLAGGAVAPLATLPSFGDVTELAIEPFTRDLVYTAAGEATGVIELYRVPLDGSAPARRLNPSPVTGGDVQIDFVSQPLGTLYRADMQRDEVFELYISF